MTHRLSEKILNIKPSAQLGKILNNLHEAQLNGEITTKEEAIVFVKSFKINNALSGHQAERSRLSGKRTDLYTERTDVQDALMELNRMLTEYD